jgi:serine/threonine-protein kinase
MTGASTNIASHPRGCLDETTVLDLLAGYLEPEPRAEAEAHMATCEACRRLVSVLASGSGHAAAESSPALDGAPELVAGKYLPLRVIGEGGMGFVVEAEHVVLERPVAIKLMKPGTARVPGAATRFLREARAAVSIQGEHFAHVLDVGSLGADDAAVLRPLLGDIAEGTPYMVMELLRGVDLATLLRACGRLPVDDAVDYVLQACEAIAEAHRLGIVHRDLKPANLFLTSRPDKTSLVRVLDFGISKTIAAEDGYTTTAGAALGSPRYMSPEAMRDAKTVDARADVWALGCILYELVGGLPAFDSDSVAGLAARIAIDPAPLLRAVVPAAPVQLERVIVACLEKEPARRLSGVAELSRALAPLAPAHARLSIERIARIAPDASVPVEGPQRRPSGRRPLVLVATGACIVGAALVLSLMGRTRAERAADPPVAAAPPPARTTDTAVAPTVEAPETPAPSSHVDAPMPIPSARTAPPAPRQLARVSPAPTAPGSAAPIAPVVTAPPAASSPTDETDPHGLRDRK